MQLAKEKIEWRRVVVVVVSFAEPERVVSYQRRHQRPFVMLVDPYRSTYREFSLARLPWYRLFSPSTLMLYAGLMLRKRKVENYGKDDYSQAGGDSLVGADGIILFAYRSHDPSDRPPVSRLLAEVDKAQFQIGGN